MAEVVTLQRENGKNQISLSLASCFKKINFKLKMDEIERVCPCWSQSQIFYGTWKTVQKPYSTLQKI